MQVYFLSIVVFVVMGLYLMVENNTPSIMHVSVGSDGIQLGTQFYEYSKIANFSVVYHEKTPVLLRIFLRNGGL